MTTVYCAECGAELDRKPSNIQKSVTGLFFCNHAERSRYEQRTGIQAGKIHQRGWRKAGVA
jgi:hypothetical protein